MTKVPLGEGFPSGRCGLNHPLDSHHSYRPDSTCFGSYASVVACVLTFFSLGFAGWAETAAACASFLAFFSWNFLSFSAFLRSFSTTSKEWMSEYGHNILHSQRLVEIQWYRVVNHEVLQIGPGSSSRSFAVLGLLAAPFSLPIAEPASFPPAFCANTS